jgi:hypothetical protein
MLQHHFYSIQVIKGDPLYREFLTKLLNDLSNGWVIVSAAGTNSLVQYILQKETDSKKTVKAKSNENPGV